jgi:hypothetical protein
MAAVGCVCLCDVVLITSIKSIFGFSRLAGTANKGKIFFIGLNLEKCLIIVSNERESQDLQLSCFDSSESSCFDSFESIYARMTYLNIWLTVLLLLATGESLTKA